MIQKLKPYFSLSKRDQRSSLVLIFLLLMSIYLPKLFNQALANHQSVEVAKIHLKKNSKLERFIKVRSPSIPFKTLRHYPSLYNYHHNAMTMNYKDWDSLGIFEKREISELLKWRTLKGGHITYKEVVVKFDLSKEQAHWLKRKVNIED